MLENEAGVRFQTLEAKSPIILFFFSFPSEKCFLKSIFSVSYRNSLTHTHTHTLTLTPVGRSVGEPRAIQKENDILKALAGELSVLGTAVAVQLRE